MNINCDICYRKTLWTRTHKLHNLLYKCFCILNHIRISIINSISWQFQCVCPSGYCVPKQTYILLISVWDNKARIDVEHIFVLYWKTTTNKSKLISFCSLQLTFRKICLYLLLEQIMALIFLEICYEICFMANANEDLVTRLSFCNLLSMLDTGNTPYTQRLLMRVKHSKIRILVGLFINRHINVSGWLGSVVGWGNMLQTGKPRVRITVR
jgi:hypothetical protein